MLNTLELKIRQMKLALGQMEDPLVEASKIRTRVIPSETGHTIRVDFDEGTTPESLANAASLLCANIACIKDHLKVWCKKNGVQFNGEKLIDGHRDVAIVHDLWNVDKHGELNRPRSGLTPSIRGLSRSLTIASGGSDMQSANFVFDMATGQMVSSESTNCALIIDGEVVDKNGNPVGRFFDICSRATNAWEAELKKAGAQVASE